MNSQTTLPDANSEAPDCVGALIRDDKGRVFIHRRSPTRRLFPGTWDIVGGHVEKGETAIEALAREIIEETGWELSRICAEVSEWQWESEGVVRREIDYLVEIFGNLTTPSLEVGKHDAYRWVGLDDVDMMMDGRTDGDYRLRDIVIKALQWAS
jgi:8-oxo-dGTP pyrophosphatase MutT (NUDIX family)